MSLATGPVVVLVLAHDRPRYLARTLRTLIRAHGADRYPIIVSQDGEHPGVSRVVAGYSGRVDHRFHRDRPAPAGPGDHLHGYACIAAHYGAALARVFRDERVQHALIVEDDLEIAADFFTFFEATLPLLDRDPTIWAVSAWNDNGRAERAVDARRVLRSDWFPNLGWSMSRRLWGELGPKWPARYWDDWMREPEQRRGRATLRPEVSRVRTFGAVGTSRGQYFRRHIRPVVLNRAPTCLDRAALVGLERDRYDRAYLARVARATPIAAGPLPRRPPPGDLRQTYRGEDELVGLLRAHGLMDDVRGGTARTAYRGVVELRHRGQLVFLAPADLEAAS